MNMVQREELWYAFITRPRHEKKVRDQLEKKGIIHYLPIRKTLNQWRDRKRWVEAPLFSCYIFSKIPYVDRYDVLKIPSVVRIVGFNNRPTPVREDEIETIKLVLNSHKNIEVYDGLVPGDRIRILSGPLRGIEGYLSEIRGNKWLVIYIQAIAKSILVDAAENLVEKVCSV
jgi:transcription antitermination factor NusG